MSRRVLITGARAIAALDIARAFKRAGFIVHMADSMGGEAAKRSRYVDHFHRYPSPSYHLEAFGAQISALIQELDPELIVPTCEEVFHLARLNPTHPVHAKLFAPNLSVLRQLHDKALFAQLCQTLEIDVPKTTILSHQSDTVAFAGTSNQWVFKPCFSRFGTFTLIGPTTPQLAAINILPDQPWVAQARIIGQEVCFQAIARGGQVHAFASYNGTWRLANGASIAFRELTGQAHERLAVIARKLASALSITGQFACDAIIDSDGVAWLIECNPRATSGVHFLIENNILVRAMVDNVPANKSTITTKNKYLLPAMLTFGLAQALLMGKLAQWWSVLSSGHDVVSVKGDRWPILGALLDGIKFMQVGYKLGVTATAATTSDIEWNGEVCDEPIT